MNSSLKYLAVDLGGESGRVVSGAFDGKTVEVEELHRFATGGIEVDSTLRWDIHRIWQGIQAGLQTANKKYDKIESVGVDSWGVDYVLLDDNEQLVELPYHYRDRRNIGTLDQITEIVPKSELFATTGIQFMEINTLCQLFAGQRCGDALNKSQHLLTIADYFHWCLCGSKTIEFTFATTTQCFDPVKRNWATSLLDRLKIPTHMLPEVVSPGTNLGNVRESVQKQTGIGKVPVIAPATHDTASAVVAVPVATSSAKNWAYISSGTWSLVGLEVDTPVISAEALMANVTNEGGVDGTWRLLKNVMGLWLVQRLRLAFSSRGFEASYEKLTELAGQATSAGCFIDPDDPSFLNPPNMEEAIFRFCNETGQAPPADEGEMVKCVLESLALRYSQVLKEVSALAKTRIDVIHVVGGGCKNILLNQYIAGATQLPVVAGPSEATALGNLMIQCKSAGKIGTLGDVRTVIRDSVELIEFEPTALTYWQDALVKFEGLCKKRNSQNVAQASGLSELN
ncbi:rhamnulokinase [Mariniblastus fucicola]|uniref:Rhamnulokinase n=1 Tax=Mariniblastus fucicola TaxID=980251 RepID=A0A5B9PCT8_9BACT|nr:rhamnulokinase family protein [Mariniblastus fucicola]QEG22880.1 Rhamnulokinase [Mariniblastus fucicola]